jgi:serine protease Do
MNQWFKQTWILLCFIAITPYAVANVPNLAEMVSVEGKAVVNILAATSNGTPSATGSGFIISSDGFIVTNAHVIAKAKTITVSLTDKRQFQAKVMGADARTDVALLKITGPDLPIARLAAEDTLRVGDSVVAIGSPFGFDNTVTSGIVSAKNRELPNEIYVPFIQTDVAVNPGNSGGPLYNASGEVVGINSQIYSRSGGFMGISFAIPIAIALDVVDQLKQFGYVKRARIGITSQDLTPTLATAFGLSTQQGAIVTSIYPQSPADKAGLTVGDIITKINQNPVSDAKSVQKAINQVRPGSTIAMDVLRHKSRLMINVVTDEQKGVDPSSQSREYTPEDKSFSPSALGLALTELTPQQLNILGVRYGLLVRQASGVAKQSGMMPGDVILAVGQEPLKSQAHFVNELKQAQANKAIAFQVWNNGQLRYVALNLAP